MIHPQKCLKLVERLERLASDLADNNEYAIHSRINQFFYMQRAEEMKTVLERFQEGNEKSAAATRWIQAHYPSTYHQWRKDVRWLNRYLRNRTKMNTIL